MMERDVSAGKTCFGGTAAASRMRLAGAGAMLAGLILLSLAIGYVDLSPWRLLSGVWAGEWVPTRILIDLRLPRTVLCVAVGAALGMSGAALQGLLRNPLAEPGLLGITSGAALGAVGALYTGLAQLAILALPLAGMAGTLLAVLLVLALARRGEDTTTLLLAGVAISSLAGALIALVMNWSRNAFALQEIVFWMMGSLADRSMREVWLAVPAIVVGLLVLAGTRQGLQALSLGEETAHSLGIDLRRLRLRVLLGTALSVGAAVSVAGSIGVVGLVAPHLMRPWVKADPGRLLGVSAWSGAVLLLVADMGVRLMYTQGQELKLGVLTALIGAPFFLRLILRRDRSAA